MVFWLSWKIYVFAHKTFFRVNNDVSNNTAQDNEETVENNCSLNEDSRKSFSFDDCEGNNEEKNVDIYKSDNFDIVEIECDSVYVSVDSDFNNLGIVNTVQDNCDKEDRPILSRKCF